MANKKPLKLDIGKTKEFSSGDTVTPMFIPIKSTEIDFGNSSFQESKTFLISDPTILSGSTILVSKAIKSTSDNRDIDEIYAESLDLSASPTLSGGTFNLYVKSLNGSVTGKYIINYLNN